MLLFARNAAGQVIVSQPSLLTEASVTIPRAQWGLANKYALTFPNQGCGNLVSLRIEARLDSGPDHSADASPANAFTTAQSVTVTVSSTGGTVTPSNFKANLSISQAQPEHWRLLDVSRFLGANSAAQDLTVLVSAPTLPTSTGVDPQTQRLIVRCVPQYQSYALSGTSITPAAVVAASGYERTLSWTGSCPLIGSYQLQMVFKPVLVARPATQSTSVSTSYNPATALGSNAPDWEQKGSLIETGSPALSYKLTLAEGEGTYHWRVRAIGSQPGGITNPANWGPWSSDTPFSVTAPDPTSNWIYSRTFSEAGHVAEKLAFANGLQQTRQIQTRLATPGQSSTQLGQQVVATQQLQDYVGRDAVSSLPIPLPAIGTITGDKLGFRAALLARTAGVPYEAAHFDQTDLVAPTANTAREPLSALEQGYYSSTNDRVADAEGYPFARTVFSNDGSNRVAEQGGVGATLRLKAASAHTVRTSYAGVAPQEVVRLFGNEAPNADGMYKVITTDPNDVSTISYQTKDGKTVATALSGGGAGGAALLNLNSFGTTTAISENLTGTGPIVSKTLTLTAATSVAVAYSLTPAKLQSACGNNYCASCDYQVIVRIIDTNAEPGSPALYEWPKVVQAAEQCAVGSLPIVASSPTLPAGTYRIERELVPVDTYPLSAATPVVGPSTTTRTLAQHLALLRGVLAAKFAVSSAPTAPPAATADAWAGIAYYLDQTRNDVDGLYTFLAGHSPAFVPEDHDGQFSYKIPVTGCSDFVYFPILTNYCPPPCDLTTPGFEAMLGTALTTLNGQYPNQPQHTVNELLTISGYGLTQFDALVANMAISLKADGRTHTYRCDSLQNCWQAIVGNLESTLYQQAGAASGYQFDLVQEFLLCAGLHLTYPIVKATPSTLDRTRAFEQFEYDPTDPAHVACLRAVGVNDAYQVPPQAPPALADVLNLFSTYPLEKRNSVYLCLHYANNPTTGAGQTPAATSTDPSVAASHAETLSQQARQTCEDRRDEFRRIVVLQLHQQGVYVSADTYAWTPGPAPTGPPILTQNPIPRGATFVENCEVEELVQTLVDACKGNCTLDVVTIPNATPPAYQVGTLLQLEALKQAMFSPLNLDINNPAAGCLPNWTNAGNFVDNINNHYDVSLAAQELLTGIRSVTNGANRLAGNATRPLLGCAGQLNTLGEKARNIFSFPISLSLGRDEWHYADYPLQDRIPGEEHDVTLLDARAARPVVNTYPPLADRFNFVTDYLLVTKKGGALNDACPPTTSSAAQGAYAEVLNDAQMGSHVFFVRFTESTNSTQVFEKSRILAISEPYIAFPSTTPMLQEASSEGVVVRLLYQSASGTISWVSAAIQVHEENNNDNAADIVWKHKRMPEVPCPANTLRFVTKMCYQWGKFEGIPIPPADFPVYNPVMEPCNVAAARTLRTAFEAEKARWVDLQLTAFSNQFQDKCVALAAQQETFTIGYELGYHHFTLYYYDRAGNLMKTVPPAGVAPLSTSNIALCVSTTPRAQWPVPVHRLATTYVYNSLHQLEKQRSPDGGETHFFYNRKGQLRFSQNARQRLASPAAYSYTRYDALGRVTEVGENTAAATGTNVTYDQELTTPRAYAEDMSFPSATTSRQVTRTVYGDQGPLITYQGRTQSYLLNRVASSAYDVDGNPATTADASTTYYSYDPHGNVEWLVQEQPVLGRKGVRYEYDLVSNKVTKVLYQENLADQFYHRYDYDADNRLVQVQTSSDGTIWDQDARYTYFAHGPLKRLEVGEDHVQGIDYTYTLQGWLKGLNHPGPSPSQDPGQDGIATGLTASAKDAFGMALGYFTGDFTTANAAWTNGTGSVLQPQNSLYNGNIAAWTTKTRDDVASLRATPSEGAVGEQYRYDQLNRLRSSDLFRAPVGGGTLQATPDYGTSYTYDPNGNLLTLSRKGNTANGTNGHQLAMDELTYKYNTATGQDNQLRRVDDPTPNQAYYDDIKQTTAGATAAQYTYDAIGNLTTDATNAADPLVIQWNVYGKIAQITQTSAPATYYGYDALGNRIHKSRTTDGRTFKHVYYVRDVQGNVLAVYEQTQTNSTFGAIALTEQPIYGSSRLGLRKPTSSPTAVPTEYFTRVVGQKQYELSDHLGNVRALVSDVKRPDATAAGTYKPDLLAYYNYYPFGMLQPDRAAPSNASLAGGYRYGFNGKEKDNNGEIGLTSYDYGFRIYNPGLGKFLSVDPLASSYPWNSAYAFAENDVIRAVDLDGLEKFILTVRTFLPYNFVVEPIDVHRIDEANVRSYAQLHNVGLHGGYKTEQTFIIDFDKPTQSEVKPLKVPRTYQKNLASQRVSNFNNPSDGSKGGANLHMYTEAAMGESTQAASNPAFTVWGINSSNLAPTIDYSLKFILQKDGKYKLDISFDGFPGMEVFLQDITKGTTDLLYLTVPFDAGTTNSPRGLTLPFTKLLPYLGDIHTTVEGKAGDKPQQDHDKPNPGVEENKKIFEHE